MLQYLFPSEQWAEALQSQLNSSGSYADAAKNWEGDFYFVVEPDLELRQPVIIYLDLWHGHCREARVVDDPGSKTPAYIMSGTYSKWKRVVTAQLDPIQALMMRQLKLKGDLIMIVKNVKAAQEMVRACTRIPTLFPC